MGTNRFVDDIRKIVQIDPNQSTLQAATVKPDVSSTRGIAYKNPDGQGTSAVSGTPGQTIIIVQQSGNLSGTTLGLDTGNQGDKGSKVDPNNPTNSSYTPTAGVFSVTDVIDGTGGPTLQDGTTQGLGNYIDSSGNTLNGLDGLVDCASGKSLDLRFDGMFVPPDGWDDADTPPNFPLERQTKAGSRWRYKFDCGTATPNSSFCPAPSRTLFPTIEEAQADYQVSFPTLASFSGAGESGANYCGSAGFISSATNIGTHDNSATSIFFWEELSCTPGVGTCPVADILSDPNEKWPADGKMQLARINGQWVGHNREPAADKITTFGDNSHSRIDFCFDSGRTGSIVPAINGGYAIGETTGGVFTSDVKYFSSDNKLLTVLKQDEIAPYLP